MATILKPAPAPGTSTTGSIDLTGNTDEYAFALTAGYAYQFDLSGLGSSTGTLPTPSLRLTEKGRNNATTSTLLSVGSSRLTIQPTVNDTYNLDVLGAGTGTYTLTVSPQDEYTDYKDATAPTLAIGGSIGGALQTVADADQFAVNLVAGYSYQFDLEGQGTNAGTLNNPALTLTSATSSRVLGLYASPVVGDRRVSYTAEATGAYFLEASGAGIGSYSLVSGPADDNTSLPDTTVVLTPGGSISGTIETAYDVDTFKISLSQGVTYEFDVLSQGSGAGTAASVGLTLTAAGSTRSLVAGTSPSVGDARLVYTPSASGAFNIYVGGPSTGATPGTYRLSAPISVSGGSTDSPGNQIYFGNSTKDSLTFNEGRRGVTTTQTSGSTEITIDHLGQTDTARGIEELRFIDGRITFDPTDPAAQVTRMYQAALGRTPDQIGLNYWTAAIKLGTPLTNLAAGFLGSGEFNTRYGNIAATSDFVTAIYNNVLGRAPDGTGLAFYVGNIDGGRSSRADVLTQISESAENKSGTAPIINAGIWDASETAQQVARLYDTALGRLPDAAGLSYWTTTIDAGNAALINLAQTFTTSAEFIKNYGNLDNQSFVQAVYANTLGHPGDDVGVNYWTTTLNAGATRAAVTIGFSESAEHQAKTAPNTGGDTMATFGIKLA